MALCRLVWFEVQDLRNAELDSSSSFWFDWCPSTGTSLPDTNTFGCRWSVIVTVALVVSWCVQMAKTGFHTAENGSVSGAHFLRARPCHQRRFHLCTVQRGNRTVPRFIPLLATIVSLPRSFMTRSMTLSSPHAVGLSLVISLHHLHAAVMLRKIEHMAVDNIANREDDREYTWWTALQPHSGYFIATVEAWNAVILACLPPQAFLVLETPKIVFNHTQHT